MTGAYNVLLRFLGKKRVESLCGLKQEPDSSVYFDLIRSVLLDSSRLAFPVRDDEVPLTMEKERRG